MTDNGINKSLNIHLGLPDDYDISKFDAFKLYEYFKKIFPVETPISALNLFYYIDHNGDFVNHPKNKRDSIVNIIFDRLDSSDRFELLGYIEYHKETNGFTTDQEV